MFGLRVLYCELSYIIELAMLKSTYKAAVSSTSEEPSLPPGWTEHKAPTGHSYYYNADTKQSTYNRPAAPHSTSFLTDTTATSPAFGFGNQPAAELPQRYGPAQGGSFRGGPSYQDRSKRQRQQDRPKKKKAIPGCEPWILVTTKLGRRFVYNPEKNESFWKFPQNVLLATFDMDRNAQDERGKKESERLNTEATVEQNPYTSSSRQKENEHQQEEDNSDSFEEVEVTDDDEADTENLINGKAPSPKQHKDLGRQTEEAGPVEFNEEDIAYHLAQMGQDYGLDPGEYGDVEEGDFDRGLQLSREDAQALFYDLLSDFSINPYTTWEKIIEKGFIIDDDRYVALPNMRARKEAFTSWSTAQIQKLKDKRATEEKKDPKILYIRFLHEHATPKLYWPEFKHKFRKDPALRSADLSEKDRERLYRDHINRLKLPESTRKTGLKDLLKSISLQDLHRDCTLETLPPSVLTDLRFISLPSKSRDPLVEAYISTLPSPPPAPGDFDPSNPVEHEAEAGKRERRERALRDREKMVQEEKRKIMGKMKEGRALMREEERELEEALRSKGREASRGYLQGMEAEQRKD